MLLLLCVFVPKADVERRRNQFANKQAEQQKREAEKAKLRSAAPNALVEASEAGLTMASLNKNCFQDECVEHEPAIISGWTLGELSGPIQNYFTHFKNVSWPAHVQINQRSGTPVFRGLDPLPTERATELQRYVRMVLDDSLEVEFVDPPLPLMLPAAFAIARDTATASWEIEMLPTLRITLSGSTRAVLVVKAEALVQHMISSKVVTSDNCTITKARDFLRGCRRDVFKLLHEKRAAFLGTVGVGDALWVPPGFLFIEQTQKQDVFGVKIGMLPRTNKMEMLLRSTQLVSKSFGFKQFSLDSLITRCSQKVLEDIVPPMSFSPITLPLTQKLLSLEHSKDTKNSLSNFRTGLHVLKKT